MATTATAGWKNPTWGTTNGGAETPGTALSGGTTPTLTGATIDLATTLGTNVILPTDVSLKFGIDAGTPTNTTPSCEVYALWKSATGTGVDVDSDDADSQLLMAKAHTTTAAWAVAPSNIRSIPVKARYLRIRYKALAGNGTWKCSCSYAKMFPQSYNA